MGLKIINKRLTSDNRADIRDEVTNWFLKETPGTGTGDLASKTHYIVESYGGVEIEIHRPATLNKGFDFTVNLNGMKFKKNRYYTAPSHSDVISALEFCRNKDCNIYDEKIKPILNDIFDCKNIVLGPTIASFVDCDGNVRPIEIIIYCVKWLFIEQDITYWNWSGRQMLYNSLKNKNLI